MESGRRFWTSRAFSNFTLQKKVGSLQIGCQEAQRRINTTDIQGSGPVVQTCTSACCRLIYLSVAEGWDWVEWDGSDGGMDGHRGMAGYTHQHTGVANTDDDQGVLRNSCLYRNYRFSAFSSISLSVKTKLDRKVRKERNFITCKKCMLISSYSSE